MAIIILNTSASHHHWIVYMRLIDQACVEFNRDHAKGKTLIMNTYGSSILNVPADLSQQMDLNTFMQSSSRSLSWDVHPS
jgi:hypothetical protein